MDISEKTKVQLWAVLSALPFVVGGVVWLTTIHASALQAERTNERQEIKLEAQMDLLLEIRDRIIRIEEAVKTKSRGD